MSTKEIEAQASLFGHPTGLYTLFFAEMWERFSYYGMRALLILYMIKGFLGYGDKDANAVYGAYTALVYMTPFFGGMIADKLLGARTTVIIGGIFMSLGHLVMTQENDLAFFTALGLLIVGNGFFKPNISTMVGSLYPEGSPKRDGGFTIFYIGINLGAAIAPLLCGYIGETYGWHWGFGLATIGMMVGLAIFAAPTILTQIMIGSAALASIYSLLVYNSGDPYTIYLNYFVALALLASGGAAVLALAKGGLPDFVGRAPNPSTYFKNLGLVLSGSILLLPVFVVLVSGFSVLPGFDEQVTLLPESTLESLSSSESPLVKGFATLVEEASRPAGLVLILAGAGASIYLVMEAFRLDKVGRERMYVVFILTFFSLLFWSFFEQSGSSVNNFTDRNVDRVSEASLVTEDMVGQTVELRLKTVGNEGTTGDLDFLSQEYLGHKNDSPEFAASLEAAIRSVEVAKEEAKRLSSEEVDKIVTQVNDYPTFTMTGLNYLREYVKSDEGSKNPTIQWTYNADAVGKIGLQGSEVPASVYQAVNAIYIMIFGLVFTAVWGFLGARGLEPNTPIKFALGLIQLGLGFLMLYLGAQSSDNGMVASFYLLMMYLLLTTGELCLSPVGLSMITKMAPARLVSTVMGAWFLATAFSQFLAAIIAQFAVVNVGDGNFVPAPAETVHVYGNVYRLIAIMAVVSGVVCLALSPLLKKWMHEGVSKESHPIDETLHRA